MAVALDEMARIEAASALSHRKKESDDREEDPKPPLIPAALPKNRIPVDKHGTPKGTAQRNFTDAQSRIMVDKGAFVQAYNGHIAVDSEHQIIVAAGLSNQAPDTEYFIPMLDRVLAGFRRKEEVADHRVPIHNKLDALLDHDHRIGKLD
ncbi:MAG: hypothetical protein U0787_06240 [Polyangia bacterium]